MHHPHALWITKKLCRCFIEVNLLWRVRYALSDNYFTILAVRLPCSITVVEISVCPCLSDTLPAFSIVTMLLGMAISYDGLAVGPLIFIE